MRLRRAAEILLVGCAVWGLLATSASWGADLRAAKKEGEVYWYSSLSFPVAQAVCRRFNAKKTGVTCILHRDGSGKLYRRYLQEAKGGIFKADVIHTSNVGHFLNLKGKYLRPYKAAGTGSFNPAFTTPDNTYTILRASVYAPAYNTKFIKPEEAPKSWAEILDPKWKGRLAHAHPGYSGVITVGMISLVKIFGWEFFDRMAAQKPRVVQSAVATLPIVARGEAHIVAGTAVYNTFNAIKKGEPLKTIVPKEGVALISSPHAILKKAPHPKAAEVFTDFLFTLEAQQMLADRGLYVGHPEAKYPASLPALKDLKLLVVSPQEVKEKSKKIQQTFRKKFGV